MRPLARYFEQCSACSPQTFTRCHSVRSCFCPLLSFHTSLVARLRLHTGRLLGVYFSSGSAPRFPTRMTLLTLPMVFSVVLLLPPSRRVSNGPLRVAKEVIGRRPKCVACAPPVVSRL